MDQEVIDTLCSICNGTTTTKCTSNDPYADYEGAFKCMAEGAGDVAFVKQDIAQDVTTKYTNYGSVSDYRLLCKDGTTKGKLSEGDYILHSHRLI